MLRSGYLLLRRWGPAVLQAALIFFFSHQPSDSAVITAFPLAGWLGHLGGYGLLALLLYRGMIGNLRTWSFRAAPLVLLLAVLYGVSDELHQSFVPGREPSAADILVDGLGALLALGAIRLYAQAGQRYRRKNAAGAEGSR